MYRIFLCLFFLATGLPPAVSVCPTRSIIPSAIGRVHSPGFPGNYGANLNCKLTLNVPSNKDVEISYNHVDIECKCTTVTIWQDTLKTLWLKFSQLIMIIWNQIIMIWYQTRDYKIARPWSGIEICNHKFDFRQPKLHNTKCNFHLIIFILKS